MRAARKPKELAAEKDRKAAKGRRAVRGRASTRERSLRAIRQQIQDPDTEREVVTRMFSRAGTALGDILKGVSPAERARLNAQRERVRKAVFNARQRQLETAISESLGLSKRSVNESMPQGLRTLIKKVDKQLEKAIK